MPDKIDEAIQDIALKHHVLLGRNDPILMLQTMNERMLEENRKAQAEMLAQFKEEMELISSQWQVDAKEKAEKVLNIALLNSKVTIDKILKQTTNELTLSMKKIISDSLAEAYHLTRQTNKYMQYWLMGSVFVCLVFLLLLLK